MKVSLLDYGAGNVRSVRNALLAAGCEEIVDILRPDQIDSADCIVFPGVGSFQTAMTVLTERGFVEPLQRYLQHHNRPYLGICLGMQTLFESSLEQTTPPNINNINTTTGNHPPPTNGVVPGLAVIPGAVIKFDESLHAVPHIGWNGRIAHQPDSPILTGSSATAVAAGAKDPVENREETYFVHSYYAPITPANADWVLTSTTYDSERFISSVQKGCVVATQFHPEKSGPAGLRLLGRFLQFATANTTSSSIPQSLSLAATTTTTTPPMPDINTVTKTATTQLTKRIVVALDVRTNDDGDLVVTKGDQYDVRERKDDISSTNGSGAVRNLGKPVALAARYYTEGADEIAFLNITSFRQGVVEDMPMLHVLEEASKCIFVPLTVGGGIRSYTDPQTGQSWSALEVAARYFRAGADKVSLGSDAVDAAEQFVASNGVKTGTTAIEMISSVYGVQAVVISIDPKRVYIDSSSTINPKHVIVDLDVANQLGPNGERLCWYQCTVKGGRECRDICAVTVAKAAEQLGAGEIMLNCIDMDGQGQGFDLALMKAVSNAVSIPVIASSGAGSPQHFVDVFANTGVQAALAAGMFHRKEVEIEAVKQHMRDNGIPARTSSSTI